MPRGTGVTGNEGCGFGWLLPQVSADVALEYASTGATCGIEERCVVCEADRM